MLQVLKAREKYNPRIVKQVEIRDARTEFPSFPEKPRVASLKQAPLACVPSKPLQGK
jgi:hypothetical protein